MRRTENIMTDTQSKSMTIATMCHISDMGRHRLFIQIIDHFVSPRRWLETLGMSLTSIYPNTCFTASVVELILGLENSGHRVPSFPAGTKRTVSRHFRAR